MTIDKAKGEVLDQLRLGSQRGPLTLEALCEHLGVKRGPKGRYSKRAYALYTLYGRALQALKKAGLVAFITKPNGGPGWIVRGSIG